MIRPIFEAKEEIQKYFRSFLVQIPKVILKSSDLSYLPLFDMGTLKCACSYLSRDNQLEHTLLRVPIGEIISFLLYKDKTAHVMLTFLVPPTYLILST